MSHKLRLMEQVKETEWADSTRKTCWRWNAESGPPFTEKRKMWFPRVSGTVYDRAAFTLFGFLRLASVPLKLLPFTSPEKLSPTVGHGFNFRKRMELQLYCQLEHS
jgi:hypothetical protein